MPRSMKVLFMQWSQHTFNTITVTHRKRSDPILFVFRSSPHNVGHVGIGVCVCVVCVKLRY